MGSGRVCDAGDGGLPLYYAFDVDLGGIVTCIDELNTSPVASLQDVPCKEYSALVKV